MSLKSNVHLEKLSHQPVLLQEVLAYLAIQPDGIYIDATFGRGGHAREILKRLSPCGKLLIVDQDVEAIQYAKTSAAFNDPRVIIRQAAFGELQKIVASLQWVGKVNGILLDLGVSSPQIEDPLRGFSFLQEGPLDMRMNTATSLTAAQWLAHASAEQIATVLREYGEERFAKRIAKAIVHARQQQAIVTTTQLAAIVTKANPQWEKHKHAATRTFQALRIFINQELQQLSTVLQQCLTILAKKGRLAVISFHSLEDRLVKRFIQENSQKDLTPRWHKIAKIKPTRQEILTNRRARSALLRVVEKVL